MNGLRILINGHKSNTELVSKIHRKITGEGFFTQVVFGKIDSFNLPPYSDYEGLIIGAYTINSTYRGDGSVYANISGEQAHTINSWHSSIGSYDGIYFMSVSDGSLYTPTKIASSFDQYAPPERALKLELKECTVITLKDLMDKYKQIEASNKLLESVEQMQAIKEVKPLEEVQGGKLVPPIYRSIVKEDHVPQTSISKAIPMLATCFLVGLL